MRLIGVLGLLALCGCASFDSETRVNHIQAHRDALEERTEEVLALSTVFDLDRCIEIALGNNLKIGAARIQARIAELDRKTSFSSFLPTLSLSADYTAWDRQPKSVLFGVLSTPFQDLETKNASLRAEFPLFKPTSWFLYAQYVRGAEISEFILAYTRQMIALHVITLYYQCLSLEESEKALASQLEAAERLHFEMEAQQKEGLLSPWQVDQSAALVLRWRTTLHSTQRALYERNANLLAAMDLSPFAEISLVSEAPLQAPTGAPEALILQALLANPQLHIADRQVAIQEEWVKTAIAAMLPDLSGFVTFSRTSNSFVAFPSAWITGLQSAFTVFNGFANASQYRAARAKSKLAYVEREEASITVMLQVVRAYLKMRNTQEELLVAEKTMHAATGKLAEIEAQWREGILSPSARLGALTEKNSAHMKVMYARFQQQVAIATLMNLMGQAPVEDDEQEYADEL